MVVQVSVPMQLQYFAVTFWEVSSETGGKMNWIGDTEVVRKDTKLSKGVYYDIYVKIFEHSVVMWWSQNKL